MKVVYGETLNTVYIYLKNGISEDTVEIKNDKNGCVYDDYDKNGDLLGIEILKMCDFEVPESRKDLKWR